MISTFSGSGVIQFEGLDDRTTLEDALNDPSVKESVMASIEGMYDSLKPDWQTWVSVLGNEMKILLRSVETAENLDIAAAEANARSDGQVESMRQIATFLEETFHIEGVTVRVTLCDNQDTTLLSIVYSDGGIVEQ